MKIKMSLTKTEKIMTVLNQWDPAGEYKSTGDYQVYDFEADMIADSIRTNSSVSSAERAIREALESEMEMTGKSLDDNEVHKMAGYILAAIKR